MVRPEENGFFLLAVGTERGFREGFILFLFKPFLLFIS